jgi:hypothetical protein
MYVQLLMKKWTGMYANVHMLVWKVCKFYRFNALMDDIYPLELAHPCAVKSSRVCGGAEHYPDQIQNYLSINQLHNHCLIIQISGISTFYPAIDGCFQILYKYLSFPVLLRKTGTTKIVSWRHPVPSLTCLILCRYGLYHTVEHNCMCYIAYWHMTFIISDWGIIISFSCILGNCHVDNVHAAMCHESTAYQTPGKWV